MTSSSSPPMSDYGMWSFHIPAAAAFRAPSQTESPPMNNDDGSHGPAASAAASPGFDARSLVVKREPTAPLPLGDADVHRGVMLRRGGFDDGHQQALPPGAAVYHPFNPAVTLSPRLWTTESAADEYDAMAGSCGAGSLSGSDASCRPQPSAVSSDDRSSTSPATRAQTLNAADPAANSNSSSLLIGKPRTHAADICSVLFCSLVVLDPRVGHLSLSSVILLFHGESCPRLDVVHVDISQLQMLQKNFTSMKRLSFDEVIIIIIKLEWKLYKFKVKPPYWPKSLNGYKVSLHLNLYVCIYYITQSVLGLYDSL